MPREELSVLEWCKKYLTKEKLHRFFFGTKEKQGFLKQFTTYALLIAIGFIYLYPVLYMFSTSFMNQNDLLDSSVKWIPSTLYVQNYIDAGKSMEFWTSFVKGIVIAGVPTILSVVSTMIAGYGFATFSFRGKKILMALLIFSYILPSQVTMIPTYVLYSNLKMTGSLMAFVLPALFGNGLNSPIFILIFYQFFRQVPKVLIEAAQIDGAGYFKSFVRIAIPSAGPAILTVFLFCFVWYWNESYLTELYVKGIASTNSFWENLVIQLKDFNTNYSDRLSTGDAATSLSESVRMAATALTILPLLIMYFFLQRHFVESIDRTGITGE
ncbi:MAG: carbohydrate ABC transporter permease [Lachnospiraceae bacterium]|nr:carbohydrate ABC transporter permease [Lachnospiraceae bacterium]